MVGLALRAVLVAGEGAGACAVPEARMGAAEHPVCGDRVELSCVVRDGAIADLRWLAAGCPASMAVAALAAKVLRGVQVKAAASALHVAIGAHGGLASVEQHAEALVLRALAAATGSA